MPTDSLIDSDPVVVARTAAVQSGGKVRAAVAVFAVGVLSSLGAALLGENIARIARPPQARPGCLGAPAAPEVPTAPERTVDWGDIDVAPGPFSLVGVDPGTGEPPVTPLDDPAGREPAPANGNGQPSIPAPHPVDRPGERSGAGIPAAPSPTSDEALPAPEHSSRFGRLTS